MKPFTTYTDEFFRALAMLTLAYVLDEEEYAALHDDVGKNTWHCKQREVSPKSRETELRLYKLSWEMFVWCLVHGNIDLFV